MSATVNDPAVIEALNQFFSDLIALADFEAQLPQLRPEVEALRLESLDLGGLAHTQAQVRAYLARLVRAGTLTAAEAVELGQRLDDALQRGGDDAQLRTEH